MSILFLSKCEHLSKYIYSRCVNSELAQFKRMAGKPVIIIIPRQFIGNMPAKSIPKTKIKRISRRHFLQHGKVLGLAQREIISFQQYIDTSYDEDYKQYRREKRGNAEARGLFPVSQEELTSLIKQKCFLWQRKKVMLTIHNLQVGYDHPLFNWIVRESIYECQRNPRQGEKELDLIMKSVR